MENSRGEARGVPKSSPSKVYKYNQKDLWSYKSYLTCLLVSIMIEKSYSNYRSIGKSLGSPETP